MSTNTNTGGISFGTLLLILFIALKLTGYINWSWWWVLSPIWIPLGLFVVFFLISCLIILIKAWKGI